jgi:hypothetical protein
VEPGSDRPIETWSDDEILKRYLELKHESSGRAHDDAPDATVIIEELRRRALSLPDTPETGPVTDSVDWSGDGGGEDPSSGALPNPV